MNEASAAQGKPSGLVDSPDEGTTRCVCDLCGEMRQCHDVDQGTWCCRPCHDEDCEPGETFKAYDQPTGNALAAKKADVDQAVSDSVSVLHDSWSSGVDMFMGSC